MKCSNVTLHLTSTSEYPISVPEISAMFNLMPLYYLPKQENGEVWSNINCTASSAFLFRTGNVRRIKQPSSHAEHSSHMKKL